MIGSGYKKYAAENGMQIAHGVAYGSLHGFAATLSEGSGYKQIVLTTKFTDPEQKERLMTAVNSVNISRTYRVQNLEIGESWDTILFPGSGTALIQTATEGGLTVQLYDLSDGTLAASRVFGNHTVPFPHSWFDGEYLWLWNNEESLLHRWGISKNAYTSESCFAHHYTLSDPDETGVENCRARAQMLSETYGITIEIADGANRTSGAV